MSILMTILPSLSLLNQINNFIQREGKFSLNYGLFLLSWKSGLRVNEAISFDFRLKHPKHKNLYLVKGKDQKNRYVYVSLSVINELKSNHWKPNQTNRTNFYHFLGKVKEKLNIPANVELTPHTLRRCFTTHNALNGVPIPILQKALGHKNIRTTSHYWKGSVDIREFGEWLEDDFSPKEPEEIPKNKIDDSPQLPNSPQIPLKLENPIPNKEPELLKTIEKLKRELEQKDLIIAQRDKRLKNRDYEISLLTNENEKLKVIYNINQQKDHQLANYRERIKNLSTKNNSLIPNSTNLKNAIKNIRKNKQKQEPEFIPKSNKFLLNNLSKIKEQKNNPLVVKEKAELVAQIQVWKKK